MLPSQCCGQFVSPRRLKTTTTKPSQQHQRQHQQHQHTPPHRTIPSVHRLQTRPAARHPPPAARSPPLPLHSADCRRTSLSAVRCHPSHIARRPPAVRCLLARPSAPPTRRQRPSILANDLRGPRASLSTFACSRKPITPASISVSFSETPEVLWESSLCCIKFVSLCLVRRKCSVGMSSSLDCDSVFRRGLGLARSYGKVQPQQFPRFLGLLRSTQFLYHWAENLSVARFCFPYGTDTSRRRCMTS